VFVLQHSAKTHSDVSYDPKTNLANMLKPSGIAGFNII